LRSKLVRVGLLLLVLDLGLPSAGRSQTAVLTGTGQAPAFAFAGVDLLYALRRITAESGVTLCIDALAEPDGSLDLELSTVDIDLHAGPVEDSLAELRDAAGVFDFWLDGDLLYVRSHGSRDSPSVLDRAGLGPEAFEGNVDQLVALIDQRLSPAVLRVTRTGAAPRERRVRRIEIPAGGDVVDALIRYARRATAGWVLRRSRVPASNGDAHIAATLEFEGPLDEPERLRRRWVQPRTLIHSLADASSRLQQPVLVLDRSVFRDIRGRLYFEWRPDPQLGLHATFELLKQGRAQRPDHFSYALDGAVPVVRSRHYDAQAGGAELLERRLPGGSFEGSLPSYCRWLNRQLGDAVPRLLGGEPGPDAPVASLELRPGTTLYEALMQFAVASGVGINVVLRDPMNPGPTQGAGTGLVDAWVQPLRDLESRPLSRAYMDLHGNPLSPEYVGLAGYEPAYTEAEAEPGP
jgi:hypothetical protein